MMLVRCMPMEPTFLSEYRKERAFVLFDATSLYRNGYLLFRSMGAMSVMPGEPCPRPSIDLIFLGTKYIELPTEILGVRIYKPRDSKTKELSELFDTNFFSGPDERVYVIESEGRRYHVVASNFWIHEHNQIMSHSSLIALRSEDLKERDAYFREYVQAWYKIE